MFPNTNPQTTTKVVDVLSKGSTGIIVLPQNPTVDAIAAATSLYLGLIKAGKTVNLVCSSPIQNDLLASDKIKSNLSVGGDNLVVSFPYADGSIDKIDYNIQGQFFNLTISPRPGFPKLNPNQVTYSYTGGTFDFIVTVDVPNLNSIGSLYLENQTMFQSKNIVNIDRHLTNGFFGTVNFVNKTSSSTSELILKTLQSMQIELDKDIATNLYAGIASATNNFTAYSVNAETFETVALLLKNGAIKKTYKPAGGAFQNTFQQSHVNPTKSFNPAPSVQPAFEQRTGGTIDVVEKGSAAQTKEGSPAPQDWLKPKIFKGGGLV
ncbi:hypothetical protein A2334_04770 [Candidatus Roizmanbacteria bacterium RIFOXYB2_FULL_38_10]|uniref:DDH domain-containing protein n=1 Tax=Candidatus Roizmanbacteria bacterium RIFOXYD1_FULL_38_12 TaxID=1802093 RepID=A0A1F7KZL7_9BACT|nr:MAG: hypothetical protein A3K47_00870 [Candidatus Roizmanbacteria bacterium RIFOXYA2_FULL_38_14]OGK63339.1 MAG: hypothetical protein A3K27_00870 [Candidatus Roizmanbacteria bacterium RIFOXYA1_FULL_37_12]OGK65185.1 MAG: hypothetical protein A3K38_00870 [Candidatus Roizmanbacteria bacterium RIFOXYB1_FULL_40_23]OGK68740.1 MAG: hypothetical protein A2334_04770 [Candidatus Roizmanbacteria bacterium RIFOXYB2_FULL_38_10]OGK69590.1 MAG: hypothetical protein A3K21_00875 [Candidatus Roizmanbacteria ba